MLQDRLESLMNTLDLETRELAEAAEIDRSAVSRLRHGSRIPVMTSPTIRKIAGGICRAAENRDRTELLRDTLGAKREDLSLTDAVIVWLYQDQPAAGSRKLGDPRTFSRKLDQLMGTAGLSNIELSRLVHIDPSYISRFRTGSRTPGLDVAAQITEVLYRRIARRDRLDELSRMTNIPRGELQDESTALVWLGGWLYDKQRDMDAFLVESLLDRFDTFSMKEAPAPSIPSETLAAIMADKRSVYRGADGFQAAVCRFLAASAAAGAKEFLLYSDEPMDWMVADPGFFRVWAGLMAACVGKGIKICIIHNIDRDLAEMTKAIAGWVPLYMSGQITSYWSERKRDARFTHTLFLAPGLSCIQAFHPAGNEADGIYRFDTDPQILETCRRDFDILLAGSHPLVHTEKHPKTPAPSLEGYSNIVVQIDQTNVRVQHTTDPILTFVIQHPLMCRAFIAYARQMEQLQKEAKENT